MPARTGSVSSAISLLVLLGATIGCESRTSEPCAQGTASCKDDQTQLACQAGKLIEMPCRGPKGCRVESDKLLCDAAGNKDGDPCSTANDGSGSCSIDGKALISCKDGRFRVEPCLGANGCKSDGNVHKCDMSVRAEGDACTGKGDNACSADGKRRLRCKDGKLVADRDCGGPAACHVSNTEILCDASVGIVGGLCDEGEACSGDGKSVLVCSAGKLSMGHTCSGPEGCMAGPDYARCAVTSIALDAAGDAFKGLKVTAPAGTTVTVNDKGEAKLVVRPITISVSPDAVPAAEMKAALESAVAQDKSPEMVSFTLLTEGPDFLEHALRMIGKRSGEPVDIWSLYRVVSVGGVKYSCGAAGIADETSRKLGRHICLSLSK